MKGYIHIDDIYRLIAGHSNYHGDSILSALTCIAEGKNVTKPIAPLEKKSNESVQIVKQLSSLESEYNAYHTDSDYWKGIKYAIDVLNHKN